MRRISILIFLTFGLLQFSFGTVYYVSTAGNDGTGNGSSTKPWRTLKFAVSKVPGNLGHTIKLSSGTFIEQGPINVPTMVNIEGAGHSTVLKAASSFYYYPAKPGYAPEKFLIRFISTSPTNGGQSIKNLTINGDGKKLHGGILFQNRDNILAEGLRLEYINFTGVWLWKSRNSRITNSQFLNCAWASYDWCVGALNIGDIENVEIDRVNIDEGRGYGIKALHFGTSDRGRLSKLKIHDCRISVNPYGVWHDNQAPNMTIELWRTYLIDVEIYNNYIDNSVSLAAEFADQVGKTRLHHNFFDIAARSKGTGYGIELCLDNVEVDNNFFNKGTNAIANWHKFSRKNWNIHHNVFYGLHGIYPSQALRIHCPVSNVKFNNNTFESIGTTTENVIGAYAGASQTFEIKNNLFINSNTATGLYPNRLIELANGASIQGLVVSNNLFYKLSVGNAPGSYSNNITGVAPQITASGNRADPYYRPKVGSPLINKGVNLGYPYSGSAPDIGAYESGSTTTVSSTPPPSGSNTIVVRARGNTGSESIQLQLNSSTIATWTLTTSMANYTATTSSTGDINIRLTDGTQGRDAQVDYIQVNGSTRQAESQTTNTGVYQNANCGGTKSEWLHCTGYIAFGSVSGATASARLRADSVESLETDKQTAIELALVRFANPVKDGIIRMEFDEEVTEVYILDLSGRTMKVFTPKYERKVNEELGLLPGLYIVQPVRGGEKRKPQRLIVE